MNIAVDVARFVPVILAFYVPALIGVAIWRERNDAYRVKAFIWFVVGFGLVIFTQIAFRNISALQVATTLGFSLIGIALALALAAFTVYRLAD